MSLNFTNIKNQHWWPYAPVSFNYAMQSYVMGEVNQSIALFQSILELSTPRPWKPGDFHDTR
jgi:hypothetical protein